METIRPAPSPDALRRAESAGSRGEKLRAAAEGFEELFLQKMLQAARAGGPGDDLLGNSAVTRTRSMLDTELARSGAGAARLGLAEAIYRQMAPSAGIAEDET